MIIGFICILIFFGVATIGDTLKEIRDELFKIRYLLDKNFGDEK